MWREKEVDVLNFEREKVRDKKNIHRKSQKGLKYTHIEKTLLTFSGA